MLKEGGQEESWAKTSEVIAAGSRIYGFRVDNVNKKAHNLINGFHRTNTEFLNEDDQDAKDQEEAEDKKK